MPVRHASTAIVITCLAELGAMSVWFSGSAVIDQLQAMWRTSLTSVALVTVLVQVGFVAGALMVGAFNLGDVFRPTRVFSISALLAGASNAGFALAAADHPPIALCFRFLSGFFLAGVYPTAMKIISGWAREHRGRSLGLLVASLTIGSALPHLVKGIGGLPWRGVIWTSTVLALLAAVAVALFVTEGPYSVPVSEYSFAKVTALFRIRRARLAYFGYLGHMWELYGMWAWIALILGAGGFTSLRVRSLSAFVVISVGAVGCIWAGVIADRVSPTTDRVPSRTRVIRTALAVSLLCCMVMPLAFGKPVLVLAIALCWGISIIADSAQFSAITTEVIDGGSVATALAMQTATGFLITAISIQTVAAIAAHYGWRIAVLSLAAGPIVGLISTSLLRRTRGLEVNAEFQASVSPNS